jgi:hypothetical protein
MANATDPLPLTLRRLPLPVRLTLGMFMIAAGVGYLTGLIQLHYAHASPGNLLPTGEDVVKVYHGQTGPRMTQLERVLEAPENLPFNGTGSMRRAFTDKSDDWKDMLKQKPEPDLRKEREGERLAMLQWIRAGASKEAFDKDKFELQGDIAKHPLSTDYILVDDAGKEVAPRTILIKTLFTNRCSGCHGQGGEAEKFPLEKHDAIVKYLKEPSSGAMSVERLASITHTHMMGFAVLFGLTGIIFSFTSYPTKFRAIFGPWTLFFQVIDIGFWWLGRVDPLYAEMIRVTGALVGLGLGLQIICSLWDLFRPVRAK